MDAPFSISMDGRQAPQSSFARALLVFAEPSLGRSRLSRRIGELAATLDGVRVRDLYELYPDFYIDVRTERELLREASLLVFVFQLRSYFPPALLVEWIDAVCRDGAGSTRCWAIVGCEGRPEEYAEGGRHGRELAAYLVPLQQLAASHGMDWIAPHPFYDFDRAQAADIDAHAAKLRRLLELALHRSPIDANGARDGT